jgi:hypothetical protein
LKNDVKVPSKSNKQKNFINFSEYTRKTVEKLLKTNIRQFLVNFPSKTVFIAGKRFDAGAP